MSSSYDSWYRNILRLWRIERRVEASEGWRDTIKTLVTTVAQWSWSARNLVRQFMTVRAPPYMWRWTHRRPVKNLNYEVN